MRASGWIWLGAACAIASLASFAASWLFPTGLAGALDIDPDSDAAVWIDLFAILFALSSACSVGKRSASLDERGKATALLLLSIIWGAALQICFLRISHVPWLASAAGMSAVAAWLARGRDLRASLIMGFAICMSVAVGLYFPNAPGAWEFLLAVAFSLLCFGFLADSLLKLPREMAERGAASALAAITKPAPAAMAAIRKLAEKGD